MTIQSTPARKNFTRAFLALLTVFASSDAHSAHALTLRETKEEALRANLDIKISEEKKLQAQHASDEAYTKLLPVLSANGNTSYFSEEKALQIERGLYGTYSFGPIPANNVTIVSAENNASALASVQIQQPVFQGGRILNSYRASKSRADEAQLTQKQVTQDVLFAVEQTFYNLLKNKETKELAELHEKSLRAHLKDMELLYKNGRASLNDLLRVKVEVVSAEGDLVKARNAVALAEADLNLLLNRPPAQPIALERPGAPVAVRLEYEQAEALAKANNHSLKSARTKQQTAILQRKIAEADYYPNIAFSTQYSIQGGQPTDPDTQWGVMMTMDWPIWEWGGTNAKVNAARSAERQQGYTVAVMESRLTGSQIRQSYFLIEETDKRLTIDAEAETQAEENFRVTVRAFAHGRKTSTEVLDAETILSKTRSNTIQDTFTGHIARAQLRYQLGMMEEDDATALGESRPAPASGMDQPLRSATD